MAYITVTTAVDVVNPADGLMSLREALSLANGSATADTIWFSATVVGQRIVLTGGELAITSDVTIDGSGAATRTEISGNYDSRVLSITGGGTEATLTGLVVRSGRSHEQPGGGVFLSSASLVVTNSNFILTTLVTITETSVLEGVYSLMPALI